jgi:hypothetical protein
MKLQTTTPTIPSTIASTTEMTFLSTVWA